MKSRLLLTCIKSACYSSFLEGGNVQLIRSLGGLGTSPTADALKKGILEVLRD